MMIMRTASWQRARMQLHFNYNSRKIYNYNVGIIALHNVLKQLKTEFLFWMAEFSHFQTP